MEGYSECVNATITCNICDDVLLLPDAPNQEILLAFAEAVSHEHRTLKHGAIYSPESNLN